MHFDAYNSLDYSWCSIIKICTFLYILNISVVKHRFHKTPGKKNALKTEETIDHFYLESVHVYPCFTDEPN